MILLHKNQQLCVKCALTLETSTEWTICIVCSTMPLLGQKLCITKTVHKARRRKV